MVTDPVCGMEISEGDAADAAELEGRVYYFCSPECASSFSADPADYV